MHVSSPERAPGSYQTLPNERAFWISPLGLLITCTCPTSNSWLLLHPSRKPSDLPKPALPATSPFWGCSNLTLPASQAQSLEFSFPSNPISKRSTSFSSPTCMVHPEWDSCLHLHHDSSRLPGDTSQLGLCEICFPSSPVSLQSSRRSIRMNPPSLKPSPLASHLERESRFYDSLESSAMAWPSTSSPTSSALASLPNFQYPNLALPQGLCAHSSFTATLGRQMSASSLWSLPKMPPSPWGLTCLPTIRQNIWGLSPFLIPL